MLNQIYLRAKNEIQVWGLYNCDQHEWNIQFYICAMSEYLHSYRCAPSAPSISHLQHGSQRCTP